ncbi:DUF1015 family protein [Rhabdothermincola salaria]|uniref:DUF1015 family protein n=1 Tax=Rhabdothermincola salaria TaxID=2903142 RepID=UPI001E2E66F4|nr:DUF1015 domain-containing protein [Rhabdothermincola salaria]
MPRFEPFPGIRYDVARADPAAVTAPPYDVISPSDREQLVAADPRNVVRIDLPVPDDSGADPYAQAAALWAAWQTDGTLVTDAGPSFTVYRMELVDDDGHARHTTGVVGALALSPPGDDGILPHEFTTPKAKTDRLDLLRTTTANLSAVWGLSPAPGLTDLLHCDEAPSIHFTDDTGVTHSVWTITDPDRLTAISTAVTAHPVVIADGHHRYETSLAYLGERRVAADDGGPGVGAAEAVMCFMVELVDDELAVGPIHRLLSGLPDGFDLPGALAPFFELSPIDLTGAGTVARLQAEGGLALITPDGDWLARPRPEAMASARDLDSSRLDVALAALPSPTVVYQHGVDNIRGCIARGEAQAGVLLRPATVAQIVDIAHGGERMPPKTTFFYPKPRTGIVFRDLH